jgi:tetratricopeptide (TPR) repeat protein
MEAFFLRLLVPRSASAIFDAYTEEKIGYNEALDRLRTLALLETPLNNAEKMAEKAESGFRSKQALEQAKEYSKEGDYRSAILSCRMVEETDKEYAEAVRMAGEMEEQYKNEILEQTGPPESEAEYTEACRKLDSALVVLPDDKQLRDALSALKESYAMFVKCRVVPVAREYIAKGYYSDTIAMIDRALPYNEQDMDLKALRSKAVSLYEEFVSSQVEIYRDNYDDEGALRLVEHALEDLPGDPVFEQLYEEIKSKEGA